VSICATPLTVGVQRNQTEEAVAPAWPVLCWGSPLSPVASTLDECAVPLRPTSGRALAKASLVGAALTVSVATGDVTEPAELVTTTS
jgi:hypothetical protein